MRNVSDKSCRENQNTHFVSSNFFFENLVEKYIRIGQAAMTIWCVRLVCWIPKAATTHSEYVVLIAFPLQHWLYESASILRYTYIACPDISLLNSPRGPRLPCCWACNITVR